MRALVVAALSALMLVAAGCGASVSGVARGADLGTDAASLVPPDAAAYVAAVTNLESAQWQRVDDLTKSFPVRATLLDQIRSELQKRGLTWKDDVAPALGSELDIAVFGTTAANVEYVAFAKPDDEGKLRALATKLSKGDEHYTVEQIGGWSVVADSQDLFDRVRSAESGRSLADVAAFNSAWSSVAGNALARAYVNGDALASIPRALGLARLGGNPDWLAARVAADSDALRLELVRRLREAAPEPVKQVLLGDVPSGAALAVAFHGGSDLARQLSSIPLGCSLPLQQLAPLLTGDGVLYVRPSGLIPELALELAPADPEAALVAARALIRSVAGSLGPLQLTAQLSGDKLVISDGPAAAAALRTSPKLVDDSTYKDAVESAGVPAQTRFLVYADVTELTPLIELLLQTLGGGASHQSLADNLRHVGTVVAWGSKSGDVTELHVWIRPQ